MKHVEGLEQSFRLCFATAATAAAAAQAELHSRPLHGRVGDLTTPGNHTGMTVCSAQPLPVLNSTPCVRHPQLHVTTPTATYLTVCTAQPLSFPQLLTLVVCGNQGCPASHLKQHTYLTVCFAQPLPFPQLSLPSPWSCAVPQLARDQLAQQRERARLPAQLQQQH